MLSACDIMMRRSLVLVMLVFAIQVPTQAQPSFDGVESDSAKTWLPEVKVIPVTGSDIPVVRAVSDTAHAKTPRDSVKADRVKKWVTEHEETEQRDVMLRYWTFADDGMNEAYGQCFGAMFNYVSFSRTSTRIAGQDYNVLTNVAGRGEIGLLIASGTPLRNSSRFEIVRADLTTIAVPLGMTIFHGLSEGNRQAFVPYFGWGLGGLFGFERINCLVIRPEFGDEFEWWDTCYRQSFEAHALIGAQWNTNDRFHTVFELRWTQAGKGRLKRGRFEREDLIQGWGDVFEEFQHPDFNFTGLSADIGIRW